MNNSGFLHRQNINGSPYPFGFETAGIFYELEFRKNILPESEMFSTYAQQSEIERWLRNLNCSGRSFVLIARLLGVSISESKLSEYLNGTHKFAKETEDKIVEVIEMMRGLQNAVYEGVDANGNRIGFVEVDWARSEKVADALVARQLALIGRDTGTDPDRQFQVLAENATRQTI